MVSEPACSLSPSIIICGRKSLDLVASMNEAEKEAIRLWVLFSLIMLCLSIVCLVFENSAWVFSLIGWIFETIFLVGMAYANR